MRTIVAIVLAAGLSGCGQLMIANPLHGNGHDATQRTALPGDGWPYKPSPASTVLHESGWTY